MNNSSNNSSPDDGEEHGELVWNEFDWERYLRQRDESVAAYQRCYDEAAESTDRLDEVARQLGWEPKVRFKELVKIMTEADLELAKREAQIAKLPKP